jgi:hypothetical protein
MKVAELLVEEFNRYKDGANFHMKVNELLEAVVTPEDEAKKLLAEFRALLKKAGVTAEKLEVLPACAIESNCKNFNTGIYSVVVPNVKNDKYDADEAEIALRLAHRLISKWLAQKEAGGQPVIARTDSDVGDGRKFSTRPYNVWAGSKYVEVPSIFVTVYIANKTGTSAVKNED